LNSAEQPFDADEISVRPVTGIFDQERAITAAQFQFDGFLAKEKVSRMYRRQDRRQLVEAGW